MSLEFKRLNPRIWVTFQIEGFHQYPDAPDQVAYLRNRHRHIFHFKITLEVLHDNREVEFHMLRSELRDLFVQGETEANNMSCEMLAAHVMEHLDVYYPSRHVEVEVSEDGECGAILIRQYDGYNALMNRIDSTRPTTWMPSNATA